MSTSPSLRRRLTAVATIATLAALAAPSIATPIPAGTSGDAAAGYLVSTQAGDGSIQGGFSGPVGDTIQAALALAATGVGETNFVSASAYVAANHEGYVFDDEDNPKPGALGYTAMLAALAGADPTNYGDAGTDLVAQIESTEQSEGDDVGQYGTGTVYDRVINHSLALLGLVAADAAPSQAAIDWLEEQQCPDGGWPSYRSAAQREADTCEYVAGEGDPADFPPPVSTTPDTNATAFAVQALVAADAAVGGIPVIAPDTTYDPDAAVAWIRSTQNHDGGWPYEAGFDTDANSTGLIVQAINALGADAADASWVDENRDGPFTALRALQFGCEAPVEQRGGLFYPPFDGSDPLPDAGSTSAGAWGYAGAPFPLASPTFDATDAFTCPEIITDREAGDDRYETAALLARDVYAGGVETVVIASGTSYADALAGAPLARQLDAPILLTTPDALHAVVTATVQDLGATQAIILGGTAAISQDVVDALVANTAVTAERVDRIAGANRFDTAALVAERIDSDHVYVVKGIDADQDAGWPDALAVSPLAAFQGRAILLTATDELPAETSAALEGKASATIVGGEAAVSAEVGDAIDEQADVVARVSGETRYGTALALSRLAREAGMDASNIWIATGTSFPDGLAAGPIVAKYGALMFLVPADPDGSADVATFVHEVNDVLHALTIVGGTSAIPTSAVAQFLAAAR